MRIKTPIKRKKEDSAESALSTESAEEKKKSLSVLNKIGTSAKAAFDFRKHIRKMTKKQLILTGIIAITVIGGGFGVYRLFFYTAPEEMVTGTTKKDSISTVIEGSATTQPTKFQELTVPVEGTVNDVYVSQGDVVAAGDKLFSIDTTSLDESIASLTSTIQSYQTQLASAQENVENLTVKAPFSGKLTDVTTVDVGDDMNSGTTLATLVDDTTMKLALYFTYGVKDQIQVGMSADVYVMGYDYALAGTVSRIDYVDYSTSAGARGFLVTITFTNPGNMTAELEATATVSSIGSKLLPIASGTTAYNQSKTIAAKVSGTVTSMNMLEAQRVTSGQVLMKLKNSDYANQVSNLLKQIESANLNMQKYKEELNECNPTATVDGTVIFVRIESGDEVSSGTTAMAIYNTGTMEIEANISEANNDYITEGMTVVITKSGSSDTMYKGTVTKKSLEATASNGVAYFPTTITIDNSDGTLSSGIYVSYSITVAQASNVVLAPTAAIKQTTQGTCLFIKADTKPDNAIDLADGVVPDGFYAVPVTTGVSDNNYVEIKSGVSEGVTVFENYVKKNTTSGSDKTSATSDSGAMPSFSGQMPGGFSSGSGGGGMGGMPMGG